MQSVQRFGYQYLAAWYYLLHEAVNKFNSRVDVVLFALAIPESFANYPLLLMVAYCY